MGSVYVVLLSMSLRRESILNKIGGAVAFTEGARRTKSDGMSIEQEMTMAGMESP